MSKISLITELDNGKQKSHFESPSLSDAAQGIASVLISALSAAPSGKVPPILKVRLYRVEIKEVTDQNRVTSKNMLKLVEVDIRLSAVGRFANLPLVDEKEDTNTPLEGLVTLQ